jgi:hypothetical protein
MILIAISVKNNFLYASRFSPLCQLLPYYTATFYGLGSSRSDFRFEGAGSGYGHPTTIVNQLRINVPVAPKH